MEIPTTRGQRLHATRKFLGWTQVQLGEYLEIGQTTVHRAEKEDPTLSEIIWIGLTSFCDKVDARLIRAEDLNQPKPKGLTG